MDQISEPAVAYDSYNVAQVVYYANFLLKLYKTKENEHNLMERLFLQGEALTAAELAIKSHNYDLNYSY